MTNVNDPCKRNILKNLFNVNEINNISGDKNSNVNFLIKYGSDNSKYVNPAIYVNLKRYILRAIGYLNNAHKLICYQVGETPFYVNVSLVYSFPLKGHIEWI